MKTFPKWGLFGSRKNCIWLYKYYRGL